MSTPTPDVFRQSNPYLIRRLNHPHYLFNFLLVLPLPLLLLDRLYFRPHAIPTSEPSAEETLSKASRPRLFGGLWNETSGWADRKTLGFFVGPILAIVTMISKKKWISVESTVEYFFTNLRIVNLIGIYLTSELLGLPFPNRLCLAYIVTWLAISFFFPQPPYLGPSKVNIIDSPEHFSLSILLQPPSPPNPSHPSVSSLSSSEYAQLISEINSDCKRRREKGKEGREWKVVIWHAEWSARSREVEIEIGRMSWELSSPSLSFCLLPLHSPSFSSSQEALSFALDFDINPQPSTSAKMMSIPCVMLFKGGKMVGRLPKVEVERAGPRKKEKNKLLERREQEERKKGAKIVELDSGSETGNGEAEGEESEDENEAEKGMKEMVEKMSWDRSASSIIQAFDLISKSTEWEKWKRDEPEWWKEEVEEKKNETVVG